MLSRFVVLSHRPGVPDHDGMFETPWAFVGFGLLVLLFGLMALRYTMKFSGESPEDGPSVKQALAVGMVLTLAGSLTTAAGLTKLGLL